MANIKQVKLKDIRIDGGTQMREKIDQAVVQEYAERIDELPPPILFWDSTTYWMADGHHRYLAHQQAGRTSIECEVFAGGQADAIEHATAANKDHGLRRTNADKRRSVETLLKGERWKLWSNSRIAKHVGVSDEFVRKVKTELSDTDVDPLPTVGSGNPSGESKTQIQANSAPATSPEVAAKVRAVKDSGGTPKIVSRNGKESVMDVSKIGKAKSPKATDSPRKNSDDEESPKLKAADPLPSPDDFGPFNEQLDQFCSEIASLHRRLCDFLQYDKEHGRFKNRWAVRISANATVGNLNTVAMNLKRSRPLKLDKTDRAGFITVDQDNIAKAAARKRGAA